MVLRSSSQASMSLVIGRQKNDLICKQILSHFVPMLKVFGGIGGQKCHSKDVTNLRMIRQN